MQSELTRMMDRVVEETASRGKAEQDKKAFENELEDLSANLFNEANRMVAVERKTKLDAEAKTAQLEERLQDTEDLIRQQAKQMGLLGSKLEATEAERDALLANGASPGGGKEGRESGTKQHQAEEEQEQDIASHLPEEQSAQQQSQESNPWSEDKPPS